MACASLDHLGIKTELYPMEPLLAHALQWALVNLTLPLTLLTLTLPLTLTLTLPLSEGLPEAL